MTVNCVTEQNLTCWINNYSHLPQLLIKPNLLQPDVYAIVDLLQKKSAFCIDAEYEM
jgi:hypothetical protein